MPEFKDKENSSWRVELNVGTARRLKADTKGKYKLLEPESDLNGKPLRQVLYDDLEEFWEFLFCLVEPQAKERNVDAAKFGELMADDRLIEAQASFFQEWRDFFHRLQRHDTAMVLEKMTAYHLKAVEKVKAKIKDPALTKLDQQVEEAMDRELNKSFSNSLEQLGSILTPTPGDSSTG